MKNKVLVTVVAYSFSKSLEECLTCLINQSEPCDIFVTNNMLESNFIHNSKSFLEKNYKIKLLSCSSDALILEIEKTPFLNVKISLDQSKFNNGFAYGCNKGLHKTISSNYDYCWLLNPDAFPASSALNELLKHASEDKLIGSSVIGINGEGFQNFGYVTNLYRVVNSKPKTYKFRFLSGASLLIPRNIIDKVGFMNENFFLYWEESFYCYKAELLGNKLSIATNSIVYHEFGGTLLNKGKIQFYYSTRNQFLIMRILEKNKIKLYLLLLSCFFFKLLKLSLNGNIKLIKLLFKALNMALTIDVTDFCNGDSIKNKSKYVSDL